jgi:hypothetical protein
MQSGTRPCKKRKDGAPTVLVVLARSKGRAAWLMTPPKSCFPQGKSADTIGIAAHPSGRRVGHRLSW